MKAFTIENETNNITLHATKQEAEAVLNADYFRDESALAKLAANWPSARLVEIWNSLPGETPVKKFTDRKKAVTRIWKAIQSLDTPQGAKEVVAESFVPAVGKLGAPQTRDVAPEEAPAKTKTTRLKKAAKPPTNAGAPREGSKTSQVIAMLKREGGATLEQIMTAMGWQKHTTRALMSAGGSLRKKHGLTVVSAKGDNGDRNYSITA
jgi:hypothetical protein